MLAGHVLLEVVELVSKDSFYTGPGSDDIPDLILFGILGNWAYLVGDQQMQERSRWRRGGRAFFFFLLNPWYWFYVHVNQSKHFPQAQTAAFGEDPMANKAQPLQPREKEVIPGLSGVEPTANPQPKRHKTRITTPIIGRTLA